MFMFLWQLPQNLLALIYRLIFKTGKYVGIAGKDVKIYTWNLGVGISLGNSILVNKALHKSTIKHEYGHTRQSRVLGPLYLLLVGLPSATWLMLYRLYFRAKGYSYYDFFIEGMATKLGEKVDIVIF